MDDLIDTEFEHEDRERAIDTLLRVSSIRSQLSEMTWPEFDTMTIDAFLIGTISYLHKGYRVHKASLVSGEVDGFEEELLETVKKLTEVRANFCGKKYFYGVEKLDRLIQFLMNFMKETVFLDWKMCISS